MALAWRPSCFSVRASKNSSKVPMPPGRVTKASDMSSMVFFRSDIVSVKIISVQPS